MKRFYVVIEPLPQLLCERAVETNNGYLLYEYNPERGIFVDSGYESLEALKLAIRARYGFNKSAYLAESFEEAVKRFEVSPPRIINLARYDIFCVREGDTLFSAKWDYDTEGNVFLKQMEWRLDGEEPANTAEALKRLGEYAERNKKWIALRHLLKQVVAYEVYPDQ